jgi:diguanylate cyclase (GGDEF)-like protein
MKNNLSPKWLPDLQGGIVLFRSKHAKSTLIPPAGGHEQFGRKPQSPGVLSRLSRWIRKGVEQHYWLYGLAAVPVFTERIEGSGNWPLSLRGWTTEIVLCILIAVLAHKIRLDYRNLNRLARTDGLTGLLNRRSFDEAVEAECARSRRAGSPLALLVVDLDKFKTINDQFGHHAGDRLLQCVARSMSAVARTNIDREFRIGGDEFAILLPGSTEQQAEAFLSRLRQQVEVRCGSGDFHGFGMSIGIIAYAVDETAPEFVRRADAAMYLQKAERAHRHCLAQKGLP